MDPTDPPASNGIYLIAAHDNWRASRVTRMLMERAGAMPGLDVCDLYSEYPDYAIDVPREQARVTAARLVVLLHPIHWYSMPALQKLWLDDVLTDGWAYGARPDAPGTALRGKALWLVTSTGGPAESYRPDGYNKYPFEAFLPPYAQTAGLCGMHFLPPLVLHGANRVSDAGLNQHADTFFTTLNTHASGHAPWNTLPPG